MSSLNEQKHDLTTGRWSDSSFQRSGWRFLEIQDLGALARQCDMCLLAQVRFAHVYKHDEAPVLIYVGLRCAEALDDNYYHPEKRERDFRTDLRIVRDWPKAQWKISRVGNHYLNSRGFNITIWDKGGAGFGLTIRLQDKFDGAFELNGKKLFKTVEAAKEGALAALLFTRRKFRASGRVEGLKTT